MKHTSSIWYDYNIKTAESKDLFKKKYYVIFTKRTSLSMDSMIF